MALSLVCAQFVFGICEPLILWFAFVIENYLGFGFLRVPQHQFVLSQI